MRWISETLQPLGDDDATPGFMGRRELLGKAAC